ncbi:MAG: FtsW/RodA/SpoVE family cell cycle protein, partial [Oscillospiraceae bacterium]|nr:FtsW/RodA/SpoVE family cell cycle protein [Oscillospiraceae bacterium]
MKKNILKNTQWSILIYAGLLSIIGLVALYSATANADHHEFRRQVLWFAISVPVLVAVIFIDYEFLAKISPVLFGISIALVIGVLFTTPINGATRWFNFGFFSFQPTEITKITFIIFLSYILVKMQEKSDEDVNKFRNLAIILFITAVPTVLTAIQPNYGDAVLFAIIGALMLYIAGIKSKYILICVLAFVIIVPTLYFTIMPQHAIDRIDVFLNPELDPRGRGYNAIQSRIAVGAGRLTGMGLFEGTQTQLGYLHPKTTDFIYAAISEEMGFIVGAGVIILNVFLITKSINIAKTAKDQLGSYIAIGISAILIYHWAQNIGMTMGLLPITG